MDDTAHDPIPAPGSYHWTPLLQRAFLENLAATGSVKMAAAHVSMSSRAAYDLKQRPEGAAFKLGWSAAVLIARGRLADELLDRAIWGYEETAELMREEGRSFAKRRRTDSRLGLAMLARLDRMVETRAASKGGGAGEEMLAQIVAGDWPGFLSLFDVEGEGHGAALALWLAGRDNRANPLASLWRGSAIANEVAQFSGPSEEEDDRADDEGLTPEEEAAAMTVWHDEETGELRTNFPPPEGFIGIEEGAFGNPDYERTLDGDEEEAWEIARAAAYAPLRHAGEAARRAFFGIPAPANDREGGEEKGSHEDIKTQRGSAELRRQAP